MRRIRLAAIAAVLALVAVTLTLSGFGPTQRAEAVGTPLYPNLRTLPPRDLRFDRADTSYDQTGTFENVLRFTNTVYNVGAGKLYMWGQIDPATLTGTAYQRVFDSSGGYVDYAVGQFYYHAVHKHYHFDDWGNYQLWSKADYDTWVATGRGTPPPGAIKKVGTKTTSCVMDEEFQQSLANTPWPGKFPSSGCQPDANGRLTEGLSSGWGDTYDYYRYEQWIDLGQGSLADGDYVLRSVSDPKNKIYESDGKADSSVEGEADNEGVTYFKVSGGKLVDQDAPTGTITLNHVDKSTSNPTVSVAAYGRDDVSGVDSFQLSNNGTTWSSPFTSTSTDSTPTTVSWDITGTSTGGNSTNAVKTVYARFHDRAGHYSTVTISDTISYTGTSTTYTPPPAPTSAYGKAVLADHPTGYYRLGESSGTTANDYAGTTPGTYRNGVLLNQTGLVRTQSDPSARFDGVNDYVSIPFSSAVDASAAVSVEAWIKPNALPASGQWATVATKPESFSMQFYGNQIEFTIIQNGVRQRMRAPAGTIVAGSTYHVVGTYDGNQEKLYVNGKLIPAKSLTGAITQNPNGFNIGSWNGSKEYFNGWIDDVAVYKAALSSTQVGNHYTAGTTP